MTAAVKRLVAACSLALLLVLFSSDAYAQGPIQAEPYSEAEAQSIDRMLMCPVCAGTNIDQSQAQIAQQMQGIVRAMLAQGASRDEILDFFVARYGTDVLAAPPKSGANLLAWLLPIVGVVAALAGGFFVIRAMAARGDERVATGPPIGDASGTLIDEALAPYLEAVDRELFLQDSLEERAATRSASVDSPQPVDPPQSPVDTAQSKEDASGTSDVAGSAVEHPRRGPVIQENGNQEEGQ